MVADSISDLKPFVVFYMLWVVFYTALYVGFDLGIQYDIQDQLDKQWPKEEPTLRLLKGKSKSKGGVQSDMP